MKHEKLVIIGDGPAGCTAAIYAARAGLMPVIYAGSMPGGLLTQTSTVENFPGFPEGVPGFDLVMGMQAQAERFGARVEYDAIVKAALTDGGPQRLWVENGEELEVDALIIATGAAPRYLGVPGEETFRNKGVSACATCDGAFFKGVPVVVVGGGDSAMEEALFLTRFASRVYVIHRRDQLRASPIMAQRAQANEKITFLWSSAVEELVGGEELEGVRVKDLKTGEVKTVACKGYFAALGHVPNVELFREFLKVDEKGFLVRRHPTSATDLAGVFVCGDCCDPNYRQAITAAGSGCCAAMDAERYLAGR